MATGKEYNTIKLKNYVNVFIEKEANAAITPGMLIELMSTDKVRKHASAGKDAYIMFAIEDGMQGKGIADAYAAGDQVQCWIPTRGDEVYAILADAQNVVIGDWLVSNGDGLLQKDVKTYESWESADSQHAESIYSQRVVGIALEARDLSGSGSDSSAAGQYYPRLKIRIV
jgi:hypothetical protein